MHPVEVEEALQTLTILVDSREHPGARAAKRYAAFGCPYRREKLDFGDYSAVVTLRDGHVFDMRQFVAIERKMDLDEVCGCYTHGRARFAREFERAALVGAKLYLLIENASWESVANGRYRSRMAPQALMASLLAWLARYDCQVIMCNSSTTGKMIRNILYREAKERLMNL